MNRSITINIEKLLGAIEIHSSDSKNLSDLDKKVQDILLKTISSASLEEEKEADVCRDSRSAKSRLSEERS